MTIDLFPLFCLLLIGGAWALAKLIRRAQSHERSYGNNSEFYGWED